MKMHGGVNTRQGVGIILVSLSGIYTYCCKCNKRILSPWPNDFFLGLSKLRGILHAYFSSCDYSCSSSPSVFLRAGILTYWYY